ncbi:hypothetical protein [Catellatospora tritici]|uniref:hypothetical protein n=1 Tax=Catellatospora tritici TaxID=2851566 RepID=UPI001C2D07B2|nr:hypothetical protein [Catellatospora tritici]MBV1854513.1 hypothetical protein [Catellatospora tritici]
MARGNGRSGCGCLLLFLVAPILVSLFVSIPGMILASPAIVAFLLVRKPDQIAAYPSWWIGVALAPVVAYLVVRIAARRKAHPGQRIHLIRAGILTALCTAAALTALFLDEKYLPAAVTTAAPSATDEERLKSLVFALPMVGPLAAALVALLFYAVLRLLDRKVPDRRPVVYRPQGSHVSVELDPQPQEIWWGEVEFREGDGSKDRPFVVLRTYPEYLEVLQITSQDKSHRDDHMWFWSESDDVYSAGPGYLELRVRRLDRIDLRRQDSGYCPDEIWNQVRHLREGQAPRSRTS